MSDLVKLGDLSSALQTNVDTSQNMGGMSFLRFSSKDSGMFTVDDVEIEPTEEFMLDPRTIMHGWMAWTDNLGGSPEKDMVPIFQGPRPAKPEQLQGFKPWSKAWGCGFVSMADQELLWHENNTWGWEKQYQAFVLRLLQEQFKVKAATPIVHLTNNGSRDKNGNLYPVIELVRWESAALLETGPAKAEEPAEVEPEPEKPKARGRRRAA